MQMSQLFFLKDKSSTVHLSGKFKSFSDFSGLKPNTERDPSGSLWYDMYWLNKWSCQNLRCILLLQLENKRRKNFYNIISNIQGGLNLWRMRNLT